LLLRLLLSPYSTPLALLMSTLPPPGLLHRLWRRFMGCLDWFLGGGGGGVGDEKEEEEGKVEAREAMVDGWMG
jgi:hypothetical protein